MDLVSLIPGFGSVLGTVVAFVIALSVIVAIHEYGHYIVGRWCGIKAEVFSLGFGPVLWSRMDRHGTRWQVALLPLGGYVKFLGDADAASGQSAEAQGAIPPDKLRQTMFGAPLWARAATVAAGPVFNFVLSILIFSAIMMIDGRAADPLRVGEMRPLPVSDYELKAGDTVLGINGVRLEDGAMGRLDELPVGPLVTYTIERDGIEQQVTGPQPMPPVIGGLVPKSAAADVDMRMGDVITKMDGQSVYQFSQLKEVVEASNGRTIPLKVWRDGQMLDFVLAPRRVDEQDGNGGFRTEWRVGIIGAMAFEPATESLGPLAAIKGAVAQVWSIITGSLSGLYHMITGAISSCNMSGPIGIAEASGTMAAQGAENFIWFIAVLSTAVGLLNLFPVPVLDGGHLMFFAYEAITGRPPSDGVLRVLMGLGLALILGLMVFAISNDLFCP